MFKNITNEVNDVLMDAFKLAKANKNFDVNIEHMIVTILSQENIITDLMVKNDFDINAIKKFYNDKISKLATSENIVEPEFSTDLVNFIADATYVARNLNEDKFLALDILWMSIQKKIISKEIKNLYDLKDMDIDLKLLRGNKKILDKDDSMDEYYYLHAFSRNLTEEVKEGKIPEVFGRVSEIEDIANILTKKIKNNPILIGEPGVGKTAIVEGLAHKIINNEIESLRNFELYELDLNKVLKDSRKAPGILSGIISNVKKKEANGISVVLFIDEIHRMVTEDLANIMKPELARGDLRTIGATTLDEYRKYFEKDAAYQRRFQQVKVEEPSIDEAIFILNKVAKGLMEFHGVSIDESAVVEAVKLSHRYITNRRLPDKAIDILDQATSKVANSGMNAPKELKKALNEKEKILSKIKIREKNISLSDKEAFISKQKDEIKELKNELEEIQSSIDELKSNFENTKNILKEIGNKRELISKLKKDLVEAKYNLDLDLALEIEKDILPKEIKLLEELEASIDEPKVIVDDIKEIISKLIGTPEEEIKEEEGAAKIKKIDEELKKRVQGQDHAIEAVSRAIKRNKIGLGDETKPIGSFMFLGPTGVGKTETAKALAKFLFGDENNMIRFDMSEFQESHTVSKLIGSPAGYVGHQNGGALTNAVKDKPYSVILFDEIEKAHPKVFDILLQVLDDGRLMDGKGIEVDFKNTIIILTSNIGGSSLVKIKNKKLQKEVAMKELMKQFRPEFINRFDDIIVYNSLDLKAVAQIMENRIKKVADKLWETRFIELVVTKAAKIKMASSIDTKQFGARPINRIIATEVEDNITDIILDEGIKPGDSIIIDVIDDKIKAIKA